MSVWHFLNHSVSQNTPLYGGAENIRIKKTRQISNGDTSNNSEIEMPLHAGTHIDAPYHFDDHGKKISDYPPQFWIFSYIHFIRIEVEADEIINIEILKDELEKIPQNTDFLIIKTGFEKYRSTDREKYIKHNPGFAPDVGVWLRQNRKVRAIGFDFISLTSYQNRDLGRVAHRAFLSTLPDGHLSFDHDPILIVEDMKLSEMSKAPEQVIMAPLMVENADGAPVTILAKV